MLSNIEIIARLALAALLGSVVGLERERLLWAAGLRTHMLVCVGACLIMIVSAFGFSDAMGATGVVLDPSRLAAQVVSGIGFLGAGTILLRGEVVRGLTTAASLWAVAAVGLAVGGGLYVAALATTVIVIVILAGVKPIEEHYRERIRVRPLRLLARSGEMSIDVLQQVSGERSSRIRQFVVRPSTSEGLDEVTVTFVRLSQRSVEAIAARLRAHPGIVSVETDIG
ncbi:MgtC/SapB family protein [Methylobacterium terricola]|uniref:Protein MgtC n=1 Tax=Methylobacterium terricola TaxID=2583531 RepID=A0A5C4LGH7_9HYPH|nr:MgtC/SapB family protein [Methylobacterium terricola]TNC12879.1 MgtC/SapB family protein [Methylobacterium terricola]